MQLAALFCYLAVVVAISPEVNFPLNLQLPPVARVGKAYNFQFSENTFQPNPDQLIYSLAGGPSWLHVHSENRTLWGTPEAKDAGTATFTIVAAGEAGLVANMNTQLPVEKDDGPTANGNITQALAKLGQLSGPRNVTLLPSKPFEFVLSDDIFQANGKKLSYYATLGDHTPLPSWISFDAQKLRFAGTTPSSAIPQTFEILLIASDVPNYAAASTSFNLIISNHLLLFRPLMQTVNVTKGKEVDIKGLKDLLYLDNAPIRDGDIQFASANVPNWLSFDDKSFAIYGTPPSGLMSQDISIVVKDKYGDTAEHLVHIGFSSQLFVGEIGHLNITPGVYFDQQIPRSVLASDDETVSMDFGDLNKWLSFEPDTLIVSGILPEDITASTVEGSLTATSSDGKMKDTQTFQMEILGTTADSPANPLNLSPKDNTSRASGTGGSSKEKTGIIIGAVLSSLFAAVICVLLFVSFCRRRRNNEKGYISSSAPGSPHKRNISRPIPIASGQGEVDRAEYGDLEKGKLEDSPPRTTERPPQLSLLPLPMGRRGIYAHSRDTSLNERDDDLLTKVHESYNFKMEDEPLHHPAQSMRIPTDMLRRKSAGSPDLQRKSTHDGSKEKRRSSGGPGNRQSTRRSHAPSASHGTNVSTAQRTTSTSSQTTALSTVPSAFPQPSRARHTMQLTTPLEKRHSIRPVLPSTYESPERVERLLDRRTIDEKRHSYIRKRASAQQSPLFAGSRISSSTYTSPPGFIGDPSMAPKSPLNPISPNRAMSSDSPCSPSSDLPASLRIRKPADTPSPATIHFDLSRSLRKNRPVHGFGRSYSGTLSTKSSDIDEPPPRSALRPGTAVYQPTGMGSRSSTQPSLRGPMIRDTLNKSLGEQVYKDAELSESNYSSEEEDIADAERRHTLKPSNSVRNWIGPLRIEKIEEKNEDESRRNSKRNSKRESKRDSKRNSKRNSKALKRTNERDPTPFYRPDRLEHGGKENADSSLYTLGDASTKTSAAAVPTPQPPAHHKGTSTSTSSPTRPKTSLGIRPKVHSRNFSRTLARSPSPHANTTTTSTHDNHPNHHLSRVPSTKERHSRKSLHSRSQSRQSVITTTATTRPKKHSRSRTQSGAYPRLSSRPPTNRTTTDRSSTSSTIQKRPRRNTAESVATERDAAGNVVGYGEDEAPRIEVIRRESIGISISRSASPRQSRIVQMQMQMQGSPFYHSKRDTVVGRPVTPVHSAPVGLGLGLGLSLLEGGHAAEDATPGPESVVKGGGVLGGVEAGSPERVRVVEGKGKRPVSVEVDEEMQRKKGFGSLKGVLGRGSSIWKSRESKAFL